MKPDLSRRRFLVHSASVAGASLALSSRRAQGGDAERTVRLGVIGLGDRGRNLLAALLRLEESSETITPHVAALCDVHPQRLRRGLDMVKRRQSSPASRAGSGGGVRGFTNYRQLIDARDIDAVVVATPVQLHAAHGTSVLYSGKHLYLEKPLAATISECLELEAACCAAQQRGVLFQVGLQKRFNPRYQISIDHLRKGSIGAPLYVRAQWHATGNSPKDKPWIFQRDKSGDIVVEQGCHQLDIINWALGSTPERACGLGGIGCYIEQPPGRDTMDHYGLVLEYPGGVTVNISHLSFAVPDRRFSGIYELVFASQGGVDLQNAHAWTRDGKSYHLEAARGNDTELALASFLHSIQSGSPPTTGIEVAKSAAFTAIMCQRALTGGRSVSWREVDSA